MNILNYLTIEESNLLKKEKYHSNEIIFHENEICNGVYFIIEGEIKIVTYSLNGDEEILSTLKKGDVFANALIFSTSPYFLGDVVCKSNVTVFYLSKNNLLQIMQNNINFLSSYINLISQKTINLNIKNKLLAHKNIRARLIFFFEMNHNKFKKNISLIARETILPRPSVSREIQKMIEDKILKKDSDYIYLLKNNPY